MGVIWYGSDRLGPDGKISGIFYSWFWSFHMKFNQEGSKQESVIYGYILHINFNIEINHRNQYSSYFPWLQHWCGAVIVRLSSSLQYLSNKPISLSKSDSFQGNGSFFWKILSHFIYPSTFSHLSNEFRGNRKIILTVKRILLNWKKVDWRCHWAWMHFINAFNIPIACLALLLHAMPCRAVKRIEYE